MSLQVWLPLNGDLHNQGLSNIGIINNGIAPIIDNNGKIGKCYNFSNGSILEFDNILSSAQTISMACWINPSAWDRTYISPCYIPGISYGGWPASCGFSTYGSTTNVPTGMYFFVSDGSVSKNAYVSLEQLPVNTWSHLVGTYDGINVKLYINGALKSTISVGSSFTMVMPQGKIKINHFGATSLKINDVRLYDHCLSPKEVEEIAKGLVLHYELDNNGMGGENLHKNSFDLKTSSWTINQGTITNGIATITPTTNEDRRIYQMPAWGAWAWQANTTYTASVEARTDNSGKLVFQPYGSNGSSSQQITVTNQWKRYSYTFTSASSVSTGSMTYSIGQSSSATLQLRLPKLELGSQATPWSPALSDTIYPANYKTTIYDSSGYSNNGTIVGSLTAAAGSPRYDIATVFPTASDYFYFPHLVDSTAMNNEFTFSGWLYRDYTDATTRDFYYGLCNLYLTSSFKLGAAWQHATADLSQNASNAWAPTASPVIAEKTWTHIAFVFDNGVVRYYVNGGETKLTNSRVDTGTFIRGTKGYPNGSIGYKWIGKMSDVRTYATALTDNQIKELYNTSMLVDASGNVSPRELGDLI